MRKAVVRESDGFVVNVIEIEEGANWKPPEGCYLIDAERDGSPGDTWDGKQFIKPEPAPVATPIDWQAEFDSATTVTKKVNVLAKILGLQVK
jgi:hypothetical protein